MYLGRRWCIRASATTFASLSFLRYYRCPPTTMASHNPDYSLWSAEKLAERVTLLERQLRELNAKYFFLSMLQVYTAVNNIVRYSTPTTRSGSSSPKLQAKKPSTKRHFDPAKYSTRFIALKFAYLGQQYNGFEHHANNTTPLPTIEEVLWKALMKAKLIFPSEPLVTNRENVNWEGCEYSKCGRTDRGVSAFGQVIGIKVRSNRPLVKRKGGHHSGIGDTYQDTEIETRSSPLNLEMDDTASSLSLEDDSFEESLSFHPVNDEIAYPQILNRILPPDIRVLAWCPAPPTDFSARFSCRERRYRYFFTQPAFIPTYGNNGVAYGHTKAQHPDKSRREGWLDIEAMRVAAKRYEGLHDFRNFCKIDPSKQIEDFRRRIFLSEIQEVGSASIPGAFVTGTDFSDFRYDSTSDDVPCAVPTSYPKVYQFVLHGSAFLWHQVRHMVAILFLVGQGLESPDIVNHLLNIEANPQRPMYDMADDTPLVLWDCIFPRAGGDSHDDALEWVYIGDEDEAVNKNSNGASNTRRSGKFDVGGVVHDMWKLWRQKKMDEILVGSLLNVVSGQGRIPENHSTTKTRRGAKQPVQKRFLGGNTYMTKGTYVPIMQRPRMNSAEVLNARYAARKGYNHQAEARDLGIKRVNLDTRLDHVADKK